MSCPFCDPMVWDRGTWLRSLGADVLCLAPLNPVVGGHMLFIPRQHVEDAAASPHLAAATMRAAATYVSGWSLQANIITSIGAAATQTVRHLHLHVVPRAAGDGLALPWTGQVTE